MGNYTGTLRGALLIASLALTACSEYRHVQETRSPDGTFVADVIMEDQLANDPDPFWHHVYLRRADAKRPRRANVALLSVSSPVRAVWTGPAELTVHISTRYPGQRYEGRPADKIVEGVQVRFQEGP